MHILFLSKYFYPHIGGVETHVLKLSKVLIKLGHSVTVITESHDQNLKAEEIFDGIKIIRMPFGISNQKMPVWKFISTHKSLFQNSDIIHAHDVFWWYLPLRFLLPDKKIFTTFHGWEGIYPPRTGSVYSRKLAEKLSSGNICVGEFITSWYGTRPDFVTYGATDFKSAGKEGSGILVLGRLTKDNDIGMVIAALQQIKNKNIKIKFSGDGPLRSEASKIGETLGFQTDTTTLVQNSRIIIASSYLSILDSMAAGKPVFSVYSNPLKKDYLFMHPMSDFFHKAGTSQSLAQQINSYLENPQLDSSNIKKTQDWAKSQTWENLAGHYLNLWQKH